jgi:GrpB-like predicted nucleotidyltransferase (UPF0157 family)
MTNSLGLESNAVRVVGYDMRWPALFHSEANRIRAAVAATGLPQLALEHIGSTAVPGLAAKPILDIGAGYKPGVSALTYVGALESLGYVYRGNAGLPGRDYFRRGDPRTHHIHLVAHDGIHWRRYLVFRDTLRADAAACQAYAALKHELAAQYAQDRESYLLGKAEFIEEMLGRPPAV